MATAIALPEAVLGMWQILNIYKRLIELVLRLVVS
jgi:hypothetical protein